MDDFQTTYRDIHKTCAFNLEIIEETPNTF